MTKQSRSAIRSLQSRLADAPYVAFVVLTTGLVLFAAGTSAQSLAPHVDEQATAADTGQAAAGHKLGDHPAVVVQRLQKMAGYDYASKFYPHPAWLRLYAQQPRDELEPASVAASNPGPTPALSIAGEGALPSTRLR